MPFAYLSDDELREVQRAAQDAGLNNDSDLTALAAGILNSFVGGNMVGGNPNAKLLTFTARMNQTKNLLDGKVPLKIWLDNAIFLVRGTPHELVFRNALARIEVDSVPPDPAPPDVAATPRTAGGSLEIKIDEDDTLGVRFLLDGAVAARSVAKLRVHRHFDGTPLFVSGNEPDWMLGTGWMLGPSLLITNHHVIDARTPKEPPASESDFNLQAAATEAIFDFYVADAAAVTIVAALGCVASDRELDYALLRLVDAGAARAVLRLRHDPLIRPAGSALQERVNVLQHPNGDPMRLGFRNNFVVTASADALSYLTDTHGGASGSPICDDAWFVAGLHRGWRNIEGPPVDVWGRQIRQENYGTPIGRILAQLEVEHPDLHQEIVEGQAALDG